MELQWEGVLGHTEKKARLRSFIQKDKLPHALLLYGPGGLGKSLLAEVLAGAVLCQRPAEGQACGVCASCRALQQGTHPDFYQLRPEAKGKATPVIRIEAVRELQTELARLPKLSRARVVIIDAADKMNEAAANALLKTLEEPVGIVYFFLLTAARQALLPTILSRCMPMAFAPLTEAETGAVLSRLGYDSESAGKVLARAEGSPGKAIELMEKGSELLEHGFRLLELMRKPDELEIWKQGKADGTLERSQAGELLGMLRLIIRDLLALEEGSMPLLGERAQQLASLRGVFSPQALLQAQQLTAEMEHRLLNSNVAVRLTIEAYLLRLRALAGR